MKVVNYFFTGALANATFKQDSTDTAAALTDAELYEDKDTTKRRAYRAFITCEANDIRYAFKTDPAQGGVGHILAAGSSLWLESPQHIRDFKFISKTALTPGTLQVTVFFDSSRPIP